jgi:hypothetical protein
MARASKPGMTPPTSDASESTVTRSQPPGSTRRRNVVVPVGLTLEQYATLRAAAAQAGISLTAYLRNTALTTSGRPDQIHVPRPVREATPAVGITLPRPAGPAGVPSQACGLTIR